MIKNHKYKSNGNTVYSCIYQVVWCSKYTRKVLDDEVVKRLKDIINTISIENNVDIIEINISNESCIKLIVSLDPSYGIAHFISHCKSRSAQILRKEFIHLKTKLPTMWSGSVLISTIGEMPSETSSKKFISEQQTSERPREKEKWKEYIDSFKNGGKNG